MTRVMYIILKYDDRPPEEIYILPSMKEITLKLYK